MIKIQVLMYDPIESLLLTLQLLGGLGILFLIGSKLHTFFAGKT